jgi:hypothetical protein
LCINNNTDDTGEVHPAALREVQVPELAVTNPVPDNTYTWCERDILDAIACNLETACCCAHVGCVTVPAVVAAGVAGCALTTMMTLKYNLLHWFV